MKLLCYGDSNTFGYDPRDFLGARYCKEDRWVDIVQAKTGWDVINAGQNGREIPRRSFELESAQALASRHKPDLTLIMLGTNDLLQGADPEQICARMDAFLRNFPFPVMLIAPPPLQRGAWVERDSLVEASHLLGSRFRQLAQMRNIPFADAGDWDIPLLFDGVHFSEAGHHAFANRLLDML